MILGSIYHSSKDISQLNTALNEELMRLGRWLKGNKLSLNVAKTRSMLITTKQKKKCLKASNQALKPSCYNILGFLDFNTFLIYQIK